jgi:hypothetical protein
VGLDNALILGQNSGRPTGFWPRIAESLIDKLVQAEVYLEMRCFFDVYRVYIYNSLIINHHLHTGLQSQSGKMLHTLAA